VSFDLGDTLIRAHPSWTAVYRRVLADHGMVVDPDALESALEATYRSNGDHVEGPFEASADASYHRLKHFDTQVLRRLGLAVPPDAFFRSLAAAFEERGAWWVYEDVPQALDTLRGAGIRLGVISNWGWSCPELIHTLGLARHFEAIVVSDRVGYLKPSAGIFRHAMDLMGVVPGQVVHVGDSYQADVVGARTAGLRPVLIRRSRGGHIGYSHASGLPDGDPVPVIGDLLGLLDLLGVPHSSRASGAAPAGHA
jgi:putative hydrolase of the HAD superfamily